MYIIKFVEKADYEDSIRNRTEEEILHNQKAGWFGQDHTYWCETQKDTFALWWQLTKGGTNDGCRPLVVRVFSDSLMEFDLTKGIPFKPKD